MVAEAEQGGENGMVGTRFATSMVMSGTAELLAYRTALKVEWPPASEGGGAEGTRTPDPLLAKRIVWYLKAHSHIQISSLRTRSCS